MFLVKYKETVQTERPTIGEAIQYIFEWKDALDPAWPESLDWKIINGQTGCPVGAFQFVKPEQTIHDEMRTLKQLIFDISSRAADEGEVVQRQRLFETLRRLQKAQQELARFIKQQPLKIHASEGGS